MVYNFNAGPGILPPEVLKEAAQAVIDFNNSGLSLLEVGHREAPFVAVMEEARQLVKELMQLEANREVLFLQGGATMQFMQVPMNLLAGNQVAAYTETGPWSSKAIKEAKLFGHVESAGSGKDLNYTQIPSVVNCSETAAYLHITTNETIAGTQWHTIPYQKNISLVADMSSDVFSRQLDFNRFDLIYAGAQKNTGAAGVTMVVVNPDILGKTDRTIPSILDYRMHIKEGSMLNTPPVFAVYVVLLNLRWLKKQGGIHAMEVLNEKKSQLLYQTLESIPLFNLPVAKESRSKMNVVFTMKDAELEKMFMQQCKNAGIV
ncbi:MAG: 3-phosphoserine/phosphohydroxythreonine transaminase, partial [Bacteroidota bacterium]